jgi:hypothetical protein
LIWPVIEVLVHVMEEAFLWEDEKLLFFVLELDIFVFMSVKCVLRFGFVCCSLYILFITCGDFRRYIVIVIFGIKRLNIQHRIVQSTFAEMLEYENQMFLDILHEDGLLIAAK